VWTHLSGWARPPYGESSFWSLQTVTSFFGWRPRVRDLRWGLEHRPPTYSVTVNINVDTLGIRRRLIPCLRSRSSQRRCGCLLVWDTMGFMIRPTRWIPVTMSLSHCCCHCCCHTLKMYWKREVNGMGGFGSWASMSLRQGGCGRAVHVTVVVTPGRGRPTRRDPHHLYEITAYPQRSNVKPNVKNNIRTNIIIKHIQSK